jgi:hypothetical protein
MANLPDHLRLPDKLNLGVGEGLLDNLKKLSLSDMPHVNLASINLPHLNLPHVNLPHISLGSWDLPAVGLPRLGAPGGVRFGEGILWLGVAVALLVLAWRLVKLLGPDKNLQMKRARLGPWPVDPSRIATRRELVMAFDYLAILVLGTRARSWNHRAIARQLAAEARDAAAADELALLYERARYTTGPEALSDHDQSRVRRHLGILAGATAS